VDPTGHDAFARALAYGHPTLMLAALALAGLALRAGVGLRRTRLRQASREPEVPLHEPGLVQRHLRLARPAVV